MRMPMEAEIVASSPTVQLRRMLTISSSLSARPCTDSLNNWLVTSVGAVSRALRRAANTSRSTVSAARCRVILAHPIAQRRMQVNRPAQECTLRLEREVLGKLRHDFDLAARQSIDQLCRDRPTPWL